MKSVYCAVGTGSLNQTDTVSFLKGYIRYVSVNGENALAQGLVARSCASENKHYVR